MSNRVYLSQSHIAVAIAAGIHLFPYRTEPLSPLAPMVLPHKGGRVGSCRASIGVLEKLLLRDSFFILSSTWDDLVQKLLKQI